MRSMVHDAVLYYNFFTDFYSTEASRSSHRGERIPPVGIFVCSLSLLLLHLCSSSSCFKVDHYRNVYANFREPFKGVSCDMLALRERLLSKEITYMIWVNIYHVELLCASQSFFSPISYRWFSTILFHFLSAREPSGRKNTFSKCVLMSFNVCVGVVKLSEATFCEIQPLTAKSTDNTLPLTYVVLDCGRKLKTLRLEPWTSERWSRRANHLRCPVSHPFAQYVE